MSEDRIERWAFDVNKGEFKCPMCNTLSNLLVPHIPDRFRMCAGGSTLSKDSQLPTSGLVEWALSSEANSLRGALVNQVPHPYIPTVLSQNVRRFINCLGEVCDTSWGSYSLLASEDDRRTNVQGLSKHSLRSLFTAWSALSYSVNTDILIRSNRAEEIKDSSEGGGASSASTSTLRLSPDREAHLREMLYATREVRGIFDPSATRSLEPTVLRPLADLLTGQVVELVLKPGEADGRVKRTEVMKCFPLQMVLNLGDGDARRLIVERMRVLHRDMVAAEEGEPEDVWPMLTRPLLSWDLCTLSVGVLTLVESMSHLVQCAAVLALARLAQILIEPGWGRGQLVDAVVPMVVDGQDEDDKESGGATAEALRALRAVLMGGIGQAEDGTVAALSDTELVKRVHAMWIPFLRHLIVLLKLHKAIEVRKHGHGRGGACILIHYTKEFDCVVDVWHSRWMMV